MKQLPWITSVLSVLLALNPVGLDFLHSAFASSEQLSRNIARPIVLTAASGLIVLGIVELSLRRYFRK